jgi:K+-sensing histidine kinase KdpD
MTVTGTMWPAAPAPASAIRRRSAPPAAPSQARGAVLAAVDDSPLGLVVVRRAAAVAAAEERELVLVTVVPAGSAESVSGGLDRLARLAPAMDALAVEPVEVVAKYLARGGQRRRSRRVGATILRVAQAYGAEVIVIGLPDHEHRRDRSVSRRIAHGAPAATQVALVTRADAAGPYERPVAGEIRSSNLPAVSATTRLSAVERRRLAARAQHLQSVELPRLRRTLDSDRPLAGDTRGQTTAEYEAGLERLRALQHLLATTPRWSPRPTQGPHPT